MLEENKLRSLKTLLPKGQVFTDRASIVSYEADGGMDRGTPAGVVFPHTTQDLVRIVRWAAEHDLPLIARGAGTGLSGGAVADRGGLIVEFARMNRVLDIDAHGRSAVIEPGVINLNLDEQVKAKGLYFPPDPASQRASTIGGNVAENSGGPHCFKYGVTTNYITGLDVVLANGHVARVGGRALDYPEYDLCGLITGSEGTLALMTTISARLVRNPPAVKTMLAVFDSVEQAGIAVSAIIATGLVPATMEMMDQKIIRIVEDFAHAGLPTGAQAILIIEVDGHPASLDAQIAEVVSILLAQGGRDLRIAASAEERAQIWFARKSAAGAVTRLTPAYYTVDITVPRSRLTETLSEVNQVCERYELRVGYVFHAGDGNLHPLILIADTQDPHLMERVHRAGREMVELAVRKDGSLSGEHGVGIEKREFMPLMYNAAELATMWDIKQVFDPQGLLNPGKIFPSTMVHAVTEDKATARAPIGADLSRSTRAGASPIGANVRRFSRAGASPAPTLHGPGGAIHRRVGATLAVALALKSALIRVAPTFPALDITKANAQEFPLGDVFTPASAEEAARGLAAFSALGRHVYILATTRAREARGHYLSPGQGAQGAPHHTAPPLPLHDRLGNFSLLPHSRRGGSGAGWSGGPCGRPPYPSFLPGQDEHEPLPIPDHHLHPEKSPPERPGEFLNPTTQGANLLLCTTALRGSMTYAPDDLYITVGSGTPLAEIQSFLASDRKQAPLATPWPAATIGGLVAANVNAPLRMRYGSMRDLVLCATVALANGRVVRVGRPVIKNVAGYDLAKVFVGSYGTLGLITDVTLKIVVQPRARRTLLVPLDDLSYGLVWARQLLPLALIASGIVLCKGCDIAGIRPSPYTLAYTAEGVPEDVQAELDQVRQLLRTARAPVPIEVESPTATDIWAGLLGDSQGTLKVRVGVAAKDLASYVNDQSATLNAGAFLADIGNGLVYAARSIENVSEAKEWVEKLRKPALALDGYAIVMDMPETLDGTVDKWGYQPETLDLMRALKERWDPRGILNKGMFLL